MRTGGGATGAKRFRLVCVCMCVCVYVCTCLQGLDERHTFIARFLRLDIGRAHAAVDAQLGFEILPQRLNFGGDLPGEVTVGDQDDLCVCVCVFLC